MEIKIHIASALRRFVHDQSTVALNANTVPEALAELGKLYPQLADNIFTSDGKMRSFVRMFINQKDARFLDTNTMQLAAGDTITLMPAIAGG